MTALILHRGSFRANPYERWLEDYGSDFVVLASAEQLAVHGEELPAAPPFIHAESLSSYDTSPRVEERAAELVREFGVRDIVACQENDLERAARLRQRFGLPGPVPEEVLAYRDKWEMKRAAVRAGLPVAAHTLLHTPEDLTDFTAAHGLPVVVKPRRGAGSIDLAVLRTEAELTGWLDRGPGLTGPDGEALWLAEAYVEGAMCHLDGVVLDGRIVTMWPSRYTYVLADYRDRSGRMDIALDAADPLRHRLTDFGERLLKAFGGPEHFAFHIEVFLTPDGELVLCEAACRAGGAGVRDVHRAMFGFDPAAPPVRRQLGLPVAYEPGQEPSRIGGQLLFMRRPGTVRRLPDPAGMPEGVVKHQFFARPGDRVEEAWHSGDFLAAFVVAGADRAQCEARIRALEGWFLRGLDIV
ncbi:NikS protein [Streptomyces sp. NPDC001339]|uniref:NikS protein n=1 Tax=Streptomyces sp. NPDC001339 TaxID=3364563 RepID=UPI0036A72264